MTSTIKRKCGCCGKEILIDKNNISDAIYYDKKTYHSKCFTDLCEKRLKNKRVDVSEKWAWVYNNLNSIKEDSYKYLMSSICKEDIFYFIKENYDITIIPTSVWQKIANIYAGTYPGMCGNGIPPEHLLDMWQKKITMLNKTAQRNKLKGKEMNIQQRLNYDLSILINKYDSYLKWLEKQRIIQVENDNKQSDLFLANYIINQNNNVNNQEQENDLTDLVDDIFG